MRFRYIIESKHSPPELEQQVRAKRDDCPEWELAFSVSMVCRAHSQRRYAHNGDDLVLYYCVQRYYVEESGEVELFEHQCQPCEEPDCRRGLLTEENKRAKVMVC